jgi:hypothetical protein
MLSSSGEKAGKLSFDERAMMRRVGLSLLSVSLASIT